MQEAPALELPAPPAWSLNVGSVGKGFVLAGVALFATSALLWLIAPRFPRLQRPAAWAFTLGALCVFGAFASLAALFVGDRFEFKYVFGHGDKRNALQYKVAGVWSGQEGSFLLWAATSAFFGLVSMRGAGALRRWFTIPYAVFLGAICAILAYESPFNLNLLHGKPVVPEDGMGLAPALQNYWVTIHPPTIFLGFGSLTVLFAYAFAAMATGKVNEWAPIVRPWALVSLTLVGLGLAMGGLWAYETLGWGGFWAWDPVENTSFVPWALNAVLVHGLIVQATRGKWLSSNLLFGGLPFLAFVYGTFLTRSGWLGDTSVHSFAEMDSKALVLLIGLFGASLLTFGGLWVYRTVRLNQERRPPDKDLRGIHREASYRWGGFFLVCLALATGIGMSVPVIQSLLGQQPKVVEEWLYHLVVVWFFVPTILLIGAIPFVSWGGMRFRDLFWRLYGPACLAFGLTGATLLLLINSPWARLGPFEDKVHFPFGIAVPALPWVLILAGLCYFAAVANVWRMVETFRVKRESVATLLSHVGVAVLMAGLILSRGLERKQQVLLQQGAPAAGLGYIMNVKGVTRDFGDRDNKVLIQMESPSGDKFTARPGLYYMIGGDGNANPMVWPHIRRKPLHDIYLTLHPMQFDATEPTSLQPGQTVRFEGFLVTYERLTSEGEPGRPGAKFGAQLKIATPHDEFTVVPKLELTSAGMHEVPAMLSEDYMIAMKGMDVGSKAVTLQLHFTQPIFPVELFYKPFTGLVWGGLGILTLGGFMAAWLRRRGPAPRTAQADSEAQTAQPKKERHALAPTA